MRMESSRHSPTLGSNIGRRKSCCRPRADFKHPLGRRAAALQTTFTMTVIQSPPASLRILGGNNQSGVAGSAGQLQLTRSSRRCRWQSAFEHTCRMGGTIGFGERRFFRVGRKRRRLRQHHLRFDGRLRTGGASDRQHGDPGGFQFHHLPSPVRHVAHPERNNQSGPPGGPLSTPLTARVEDGAGNPIPNVGVIWQSLTPQAVSLTAMVSTSDADGLVSATAILSAAGPAQVQLTIANLPVQAVFSAARDADANRHSCLVGYRTGDRARRRIRATDRAAGIRR